MADNILVPWSGQRIFTSAGVLAGGALIYLYAEDTTDLLTVYSDRDLLVTQANPITCDANGLAPMMFLGTTAYKIKITTSAGVTLDEEDDLPGALNTTPFSAATFAKADSDVTSKTSDYTLVEADLGGTFNGTCTGGTVQFTLLSAVTATNGRGFTIRHNGTANYVKIVSVSSQTISRPATGVTTTGFALVGYGESITLKSDGANWHVDAYVPPLITATTGVIVIADRVSAAPASPNPGGRYIVTASYSTFETHDIIEYDGQGNYIEYTPAADCGWIAYVQDEDMHYVFTGSAWIPFFSHINNLTEDTTPDGSADFVATYDVSASLPKKVKLANLSRSGGLQLLNSGTVTSAATLDIVLTSYTGYRGLMIHLSGFLPATDAVDLWVRFSTDGGSAFDAGAADYHYAGTRQTNSATANFGSGGAAQIVVIGNAEIGNVSNEGVNATFEMLNQTSTAFWSRIRWQAACATGGGSISHASAVGLRAAAQDTDAIRFLFSSGNIATGSWALYGYV